MNSIYTKSLVVILVFLTAFTGAVFGQFKIRLPKINKKKAAKTSEAKPQTASQSGVTNTSKAKPLNRQMVMDDGYTFFDAEPVEEYDTKLRLNKDIGWYLKSELRIFGTFPTRSAFKIVVKKNGKAMAETRCEGRVYQKATDFSLKTEMLRREKDLNFDDFMSTRRCQNKEAVVRGKGKMDVEIYFIDGDTDSEKLVRTYKIDVHRATRVRGSAIKPQPDVAHYYIQRHAEASIALLHVTGNYSGRGRSANRTYYLSQPATSDSPTFGQLKVYFSYSPARSTKNFGSPFTRCSVNGQRIKLQRDGVHMGTVGRQEYAIYTDRIAAKFKRGSAYRDDMRFRIYSVTLPLYTGETRYRKPPMKIENHPGKWECQIISNGVKLRTFRWVVGSDGNIVQHAEQKSGNINLFYKSYLVDMEIPKGGAPFDHRLLSMPNAGIFYGIPWTTAEGKRQATSVPKVGNPFHVPSNRAK